MKITKTLYVPDREKWRKWLEKNFDKEPDIWLIYYRKVSGKPRVPYTEAVEEALCFGWIDSTVKKIDHERFAQRFSPRRTKSVWSQLNRERVRRLIKEGKMAPAGLTAFGDIAQKNFSIPPDILKALKSDKKTWVNFQKFPGSYKRIRIAWIDMSRKRPEEFKKRLKYFLKMTAQNKTFGMLQ